MKLAIFGLPHSHTDEASHAFEVRDEASDVRYFDQIADVFEAVNTGQCGSGIVPYENTTHGPVTETFDALFETKEVSITAAHDQHIQHHLAGRGEVDFEKIKIVLSHPQALGQCRTWLRENLPHAKKQATTSTATAAENVADVQDPTIVSVSNQAAIEHFGLEVMQENIGPQDNVTKFVLIEKKDPNPEKPNTSLAFWFTDDGAGNLVSALQFFSDKGINLTRLDSRRAEAKYGGYLFFVDAQASIQDIQALQAHVGGMRILGSF